jgi:hypothetical protein
LYFGSNKTKRLQRIGDTNKARQVFMQPEEPVTKGAVAFHHALRRYLGTQFRAQQGSPHANCIATMRSAAGITDAVVQHLSHPDLVLRPADVEADPTWAFVPVIVPTNLERHALNEYKVGLFASDHKVPVLSWDNPITGHEFLKIAADYQPLVRLRNRHVTTTTYVQDGPVVLRDNISIRRRVVNGARGRLHSLVFRPEDVPDVERALQATRPPGQPIHVPTPLFVNVQVDDADLEGECTGHGRGGGGDGHELDGMAWGSPIRLPNPSLQAFLSMATPSSH